MKIKVLGSGGAFRIPRAGCNCKICKEARKKKGRYERLGQSIYINSILFDTPEDINEELNKSKIDKVDYIFFTHWHPDHTNGYRIVEVLRNNRFSSKLKKPIIIYMTRKQIKDFKKYVPGLFYYKKIGFIKIIENDKEIKINNLLIKPFSVNNFMYGYILIQNGKKVVYCPCHSKFIKKDKELLNSDLLLINCGIFEDKLKYSNKLPDKFRENTLFSDNLKLIKELKPRKTILLHIEEQWQRSYDDYCKLEKRYKDLRFAYDGMEIVINK